MNSLARKRRAPVRLPYQLIWGFRCSRLTAFHSLLETASSIFISLLIHLFSLFVTIRNYSSLFVTIRHYSSIFITIRHYSSLFATSCHYSSLFATIRSIRSLFRFYHWPTTADWIQSQFRFPFPRFHVGFYTYSFIIVITSDRFCIKKEKSTRRIYWSGFFHEAWKSGLSWLCWLERPAMPARDWPIPSLTRRLNIGWLPL